MGHGADQRGREQPEAERGQRAQQQSDRQRDVGRQRTAREAVQQAEHAEHADDHEEEERNEDRHLRRDVRTGPQPDEALTTQDRALGTDLEQRISEPEEEPANTTQKPIITIELGLGS